MGCSPESQEQAADLRVRELLRDRKERTLGYRPDTEVVTEEYRAPGRAAYERIPSSPVPPPTTAPIEPVRVEVPAGPLGPELWRMEAEEAGLETVDLGVADRRTNVVGPLGPPAPGEAVHRLDLFGCLQYAVRHSREYQTRLEELYLTALDVTLERHLFAPRPFVTQGFRYVGDQDGPEYRAAMEAVTTVGVRQRLPYGGAVTAQALATFVDALHGNVENGESAALSLSAAVPLLRGAGLVNLEPVISEERGLVYAVRGFEDYRREFVVGVAALYFDLLARRNSLINRRVNLSTLALLTERTQAMYENDRLIYLEVQRALQSRLSAENELVGAEEDFQTALDRFKLTLGMPVAEQLEVVPVELEVNAPQMPVEEAVATAHRYRLSLQTASDQMEDAMRRVKNARNGLLPGLDLGARVGAGNPEDTPAARINGETLDYELGVVLDLPIDRVEERNAYRAALIRLQQSQRAYAAQKDQISIDVRASLRAIRAAEVSVEIQRQNVELAEWRLEFANELLKQGKREARDVVEAQSALLDAQDEYEGARRRLQVQVLEFMKDTGTLRVDPEAGAIGRAMDRADGRSTR